MFRSSLINAVGKTSDVLSLRHLSRLTAAGLKQSTFTPHHGPGELLPTISIPSLQTRAMSSYFSITRLNQGRSEEEIKKVEHVYDPPPRVFKKTNRDIRVQPDKLLRASQLIQKLSLDEAIAQTQFRPNRSAKYAYQTLVELQKEIKDEGFDPSLFWVSNSKIHRAQKQVRLQYKGHGRFGKIEVYYCHHHIELTEGAPPLCKSIRRTQLRYLPPLEKKLRHPKTIKNSLSWY